MADASKPASYHLQGKDSRQIPMDQDSCQWDPWSGTRIRLRVRTRYSASAVVVIPFAEMLRLVGEPVRRKHAKEFITLGPIEVADPCANDVDGVLLPDRSRPDADDWFGDIDPSKIEAIQVGAGFRTDFASIPFPFTFFVRRIGKWTRASVIHDFGYFSHEIDSQAFYDWLFYKIMIQDGTARWRAKVMYRAVRMFGKRAWKKSRLRPQKEYDIHFLVERLAADHYLTEARDSSDYYW